jgi:hypothetical protein
MEAALQSLRAQAGEANVMPPFRGSRNSAAFLRGAVQWSGTGFRKVLSEHRFGPAKRIDAQRAPYKTVRIPSVSRSSASRQIPERAEPGQKFNSLTINDFSQ